MRKIILSLKTMFQIAYAIDKKSLFICIAYNLIKQLMNVFYGVVIHPNDFGGFGSSLKYMVHSDSVDNNACYQHIV